jgi:hypothetical protein
MVSVLHDGPEADPKLQATIMGVPEGVKHRGGYYIGRDRDEDAEVDVEYEAPDSKKLVARAAIFLLTLAALLTKPLLGFIYSVRSRRQICLCHTYNSCNHHISLPPLHSPRASC